MDKQKTALTELIEYVIELKKQRDEAYNFFKEQATNRGTGTNSVIESEGGASVAYENVIKKAISLLPKEREDIEGFVRKYQRVDVIVGLSELFNQTFTQYKTEEHG